MAPCEYQDWWIDVWEQAPFGIQNKIDRGEISLHIDCDDVSSNPRIATFGRADGWSKSFHLQPDGSGRGGGGHHVVGRVAVETNEPDGSDQSRAGAVR